MEIAAALQSTTSLIATAVNQINLLGQITTQSTIAAALNRSVLLQGQILTTSEILATASLAGFEIGSPIKLVTSRGRNFLIEVQPRQHVILAKQRTFLKF